MEAIETPQTPATGSGLPAPVLRLSPRLTFLLRFRRPSPMRPTAGFGESRNRRAQSKNPTEIPLTLIESKG
jgi:hypothetical protein